MKHRFKYWSLLALLPLLVGCTDNSEKLVSYVDPFIGTGGHGHTYPGATVPFGMVQLSPTNGRPGWDWCSGYHYSDNVMAGFTHTHLSGTGIGDLDDLLFLPTCQTVTEDTTAGGALFMGKYRDRYTHEKEWAEPGYYKVQLLKSNIMAELTATVRAGFHRYTFPENEEATVIIDLGHRINWDTPRDVQVKKESETLITGHRHSFGWAKDQRLYFAVRLSQPLKKFSVVNDNGTMDTAVEAQGKQVKAVLQFGETKKPVLIKVGISSASVEGALQNLDEEIPAWDFDKVQRNASDTWEKELQKIKVETVDNKAKKIFYTAFYHSMLAPVTFCDRNGEYKGPDGKIHKAEGFTNYSIFSLWDTYRAEHPLLTITQPERVNDMVHSLMAFYDQHGKMPVWTLVGNETDCMVGIHSIPVVVDAYRKGLVKDLDANKMLDAMKASMLSDYRGLDYVQTMGYIPSEKILESVAKLLEYCFDDWCVSQMAAALGRTDDAELFAKRAQNYKNIYNPQTGFFQGRFADGSWRMPFDPFFSAHEANDYTEGTAWQYLWLVPHDPQGLADLMGGKEIFISRLDSLFLVSSEVKGENASPDISGMIGQYAHGNEPGHHTLYLYNKMGVPWKTQQRVAEVLRTMYRAEPDGVCGNEDCGQMSAWYILSSMGLYPLNAADGNYEIGSPLFTKSTIKVNDGKTFTISAPNASDANIYVQSAVLNGAPLDRTYITYQEIMQGGELVLEMSSLPKK